MECKPLHQLLYSQPKTAQKQNWLRFDYSQIQSHQHALKNKVHLYLRIHHAFLILPFWKSDIQTSACTQKQSALILAHPTRIFDSALLEIMHSYKVLICTGGSVSELGQHELEIKTNMGAYFKMHSFFKKSVTLEIVWMLLVLVGHFRQLIFMWQTVMVARFFHN